MAWHGRTDSQTGLIGGSDHDGHDMDTVIRVALPHALAGAASGTPTAPPLLALSPDAAAHVLSFLSVRDLGALAQVSKAAHARATDAAVWAARYGEDFQASPSEMAIAVGNPLHTYKTRYTARQKKVASTANTKARSAAIDQARGAQQWLEWSVTAYALAALACSPFLAAIIFLVLVGFKLDGSLAASWWAVASPVWIAIGLCCGLVAISAVLTACGKRSSATASNLESDDTSMFYNWQNSLDWLPLPLLGKLASNRRRRGQSVFSICWVLTMVAVAVALPVMLVAKFQYGSDATGYPWSVAFVPFWLSLLLCCCTCCVFDSGDEAVMPMATCAYLGCPTLAIAIMICIMIDADKYIPIHLLLIPLWIVFGAMACMTCLACCFGFLKFAWDRDTMECGVILGMLSGVCVIFAPPTLTCVFLTLKLQAVGAFAAWSWHQVLGPMYAWLALLVVAACVGWCVGCAEAVVKPVTARRSVAVNAFPFGMRPVEAPRLQEIWDQLQTRMGLR